MIEIYTSITAGYDDLKKQPVFRDCRYTAFVEGVTLPQQPWRLLPVKADPMPDPTRRARQMKVLAHRFFPQAAHSLWIDGCFRIEPSFSQALPRFLELMRLEDSDLLTFQHPEHDCTYEHAESILAAGTDAAHVVGRQMARYREGGLPPHAGMVQTHVILRKHTEAVRCFNERWWHEIQEGSRRDQLSFIYAAKQQGLRFIALPAAERQYFKGMSHRGTRTVVA